MHLASIQQHLTTLEHLYITYISYETSYNSLLLELERRRRYRDATEDLVYGMVRQLDALRDGASSPEYTPCLHLILL